MTPPERENVDEVKRLGEMLIDIGKVSGRIDQLESENSSLRNEAEKLKAALNKICDSPYFGPDCTCSGDCSCGEDYIRKIAKEALRDTNGEGNV